MEDLDISMHDIVYLNRPTLFYGVGNKERVLFEADTKCVVAEFSYQGGMKDGLILELYFEDTRKGYTTAVTFDAVRKTR